MSFGGGPTMRWKTIIIFIVGPIRLRANTPHPQRSATSRPRKNRGGRFSSPCDLGCRVGQGRGASAGPPSFLYGFMVGRRELRSLVPPYRLLPSRWYLA